MTLLARMRTFRKRFKNPKVFSKTAGAVKKHMSIKKKPASTSSNAAESLAPVITLPAPSANGSSSDLYHRENHEEEDYELSSFEKSQVESNESYLIEQSYVSQGSDHANKFASSPILKAKDTSSIVIENEQDEEEEEERESFDVTQPFMSEQDESIVFGASVVEAAQQPKGLAAIHEEQSVDLSLARQETSVVNMVESVVLEEPELPAPSPEVEISALETSSVLLDSSALNTSSQPQQQRSSKSLRSGKLSALRVVMNNPRLIQQRASASTADAAVPATTAAAGPVKRLSNPFKRNHQLTEEMLLAAYKELALKPFKEQAVRFLNSYWSAFQLPESAEQVWDITRRFVELSMDKDAGFALDELKAHRVFELLGQALTITEMRTKLKPLRARQVSLSEFLIFFYQVDFRELVTAPQSSAESLLQMEQAEKLMKCSTDALAESQAKAQFASQTEREAGEQAKLALELKTQALGKEEQARVRELAASEAESQASKLTMEAKACFETCAEKAELAKASEQATYEHLKTSANLELEAKRGEEAAQQAESKAVQQEQQAREAESEAFRKEKLAQESEVLAIEAERALVEATERVAEALNKVKAEEAEFAQLLERLRAESEDMTKGLVARRKAKHELEVLLANNPDHLQQARIGEEAMVRKHEKLIRNSSVARSTASANRADSEKLKSLAIEFRSTCEKQAGEAQVRRGASETKAKAAAEARLQCEQAQAKANEELQTAEDWKQSADKALAVAQEAKLAASLALKESTAASQEATKSREQAEQQELDAVQARTLAEESREQAELAVVDAIAAFENAQKFVDRVKQMASSGQGGWWWASREIEESKRFVPQKKVKHM